MSPTPEHLAVAFANTLSSPGRDRIATPERFTRWASTWPAMSRLARELPAGDLGAVRAQRDLTQQLLHLLAAREAAAQQTAQGLLELVARPGLTAAPFRLTVEPSGVTVLGEPGDGVRHLLSRAVIDLVVTAQVTRLRCCDGVGCLKVFLAQRADRRWCDSLICGNRARVAAHSRRNAARAGPDAGQDVSASST